MSPDSPDNVMIVSCLQVMASTTAMAHRGRPGHWRKRCAARQEAMHSVINLSLRAASCSLPASSASHRAWCRIRDRFSELERNSTHVEA
jgi:hypothetical protein